LKDGQTAHAQAGDDLAEIRTGEQVVVESEQYILTFSSVAAGIAIFGFILTVLGLEAWRFTLIPMAISLVWLLTAVLLFRLALRYYMRVKERRERMAMAEGSGAVVYIGEGKTVEDDPALFLAPPRVGRRSRFNHRARGFFLPVELKTGRVPKGPLFSHILQLCRLQRACRGEVREGAALRDPKVRDSDGI